MRDEEQLPSMRTFIQLLLRTDDVGMSFSHKEAGV